MSQFYKPKRVSGLYTPNSTFPFKLSRSRIENFINCPRCFYIDRKLGTDRPQPPGYSLNSAVDKLLKKEFDIHRAEGTTHPLLKHYGLDAIPLSHNLMDEWREPFKGISYLHKETNFLVHGGVDDVWKGSDGKWIIVDYKSTSKDGDITLDAPWQMGYKRQIEVYQWLFRKNGFEVSDTGYFVYCNGDTDKKAFDAKLEFKLKLIPHKGNDSWVEKALFDIKACLDNDSLPASGDDCDFCQYRKAMREVEKI